MQLVTGHDVADVIAERSPLPVSWAVAIAAQITAVLGAAHAISLVHRDLKPRNVMLSPDGTVTVLDFGVAALLEPDITRLTTTGETLGSPAYMAPEQALQGTASPRSDLYALGCVLHEMLCGSPVFSADLPLAMLQKHLEDPPRPLRELRTDVPEPIERLVLDLLAKDPEQRPDGAEDVYERLLPQLPDPASDEPVGGQVYMDPTRPYRRPLAPQPRSDRMVMAPLAPGQLPADARRRAATLVDQGRFTQAAQLLDSALVQEPTAADSAVVRGLRLDLASALLLGGDYRRALREYEQLLGDLQRAVPPDHELINHCRFQAGICQVEVGETTVALRGFRALLTDEQRRHGPLDPQVLELRRQVGLLTASSGDVDTAVHALGALRDDLERVLGSVHPEVHDVQRIIHHLLSLRD